MILSAGFKVCCDHCYTEVLELVTDVRTGDAVDISHVVYVSNKEHPNLYDPIECPNCKREYTFNVFKLPTGEIMSL
jgi:hypothetical protein